MAAFKDSRGQVRVSCTVNGSVPVGIHGIALRIAGQRTSVDSYRQAGLEVGCKEGYFGHINETCAKCPPVGVVCPGMQPEAAGPILRYPYPVPLPGFFNLNDTMRADCPDGSGYPGRDVCIVACSNADSCLGDNYCAAGYVSKAPHFRCASCATGM
jgi:hypothetical protein